MLVNIANNKVPERQLIIAKVAITYDWFLEYHLQADILYFIL